MGKEKKKYTAMEKAKRMVWQGTSVYRAAEVIGISKDTLKQHLEAQAPNSRPGPSTVLSKRDEAKLVSFAKFIANSGRPASYCSLVGGVKEFFFDLLIYSHNNLLFNNDQQFTYNYIPVSLVYFSLKSISSLFSISILNISYYFISYSILFSY